MEIIVMFFFAEKHKFSMIVAVWENLLMKREKLNFWRASGEFFF